MKTAAKTIAIAARLTLSLLFLAPFVRLAQPQSPTVPINPTVNNCNVTRPDTPVTPALLTSGLPCAVTVIQPITLDNLQKAFDFYSWLTFIALNSPAAGGTIGKDAPTIWEQFKESQDIMLPDGSSPPPWGAPPIRPSKCPNAPAGATVLVMVGKTPNVLTESVQPFLTGPLIDQQGQYVHYEILVNRPMFEFIVQNQLYNQQGQAKFSGTITFPIGQVTSGSTGTVGSIMIKAAWKILDPKVDDPSRFHTAKVLVYQAPSTNPKIAESCSVATVGLVGLHISHKTQVEPQWVWSTFEHVDNVPTQSDVNSKKLAKRYNFYNPACKNCKVNDPPPRPWDPNAVPFPGGFKSQIVRVVNLMDDVNKLNAQFQGILKGTVWANYKLISTQWPTDGQSKTDPNGVPAPTYLANTTMETYVQGTTPQASSSCIACHGNAATTKGKTSDFTYILERAQSAK
ncbi:MAG TPA: hypothetical protein VKM94_20470 [Blastocatellia bacterium]|nr:hypothetical protein [Blastocatellia bacterium]